MKILKRSRRYPGVFQYENKRGKFWGYRIKYYDTLNKRREKKQVSFPTERDAFEAMIDMQNNINKENFHQVNPSKMTLNELADLIIEQNKPNEQGSGAWSFSTYYTYNTLRKNWLPDTIGHVKIKDLTLELYQSAFINHYKDDTKPSTLQTFHDKVNALMNEAVRRDYILNNRIRFAVLPKSQKQQQDKYLTIDELNQLLEHSNKLKQHFHVMIYLFAYTGMRIGELRALTWNELNFSEGTIDIFKSIDQDNRLGRTKGRNRRVIEVNKKVMDMLKALKKTKISTGHFRNNDDYVFIGRRMMHPISAQMMQNTIKAVAAEVINKNITSHYFRHTHASILLLSGQSTKVVANRLGDTEKTIIEYYSHLIPGIGIDVNEAFEERLKNGANSGAKNNDDDNIISLND